MNKYDIEIEGFENGMAYFSIKDRPDLGYFYLHGKMMNEAGVYSTARITIEVIEE